MAYWGALPPPKITRSDSVRREDEKMAGTTRPLAVDTSVAGDRLSNRYSQPQSRQDRYSTQTGSTQSPFASPIASEFRGDGLAPRPPSFKPGASDAAYNRDFSEKRRRRENRNREEANDAPSPIPPPAAPDVPRLGPPVSYKQPYINGPPTQYAGPARSRSTRKSEGPVSPSKAAPEEYYRTHTRDEHQAVDEDTVHSRRGERSNGKIAVQASGSQRQRPDRLDSYDSQRRKGSLSDAEALQRKLPIVPACQISGQFPRVPLGHINSCSVGFVTRNPILVTSAFVIH